MKIYSITNVQNQNKKAVAFGFDYPAMWERSVREVTTKKTESIEPAPERLSLLIKDVAARLWNAKDVDVVHIKKRNVSNKGTRDKSWRITCDEMTPYQPNHYDQLIKPNGTIISKKISNCGIKKEMIVESPKSGIIWRKIIDTTRTVLAIRKKDLPTEYYIKDLKKGYVRIM